MAFLHSKDSKKGLVSLFLISLISSFLSPDAFCLEDPDKVDAKFLVGNWTCEAIDQGVSFKWEVEVILGGQWLSGRTTSRGSLQSVDIWKIENDGQPSLRRVFLADGSFVESLSKRGWKNLKLRSQGLLREKKRVIETRETLRWIDVKTFEAVLERKVEKKWISRPKEVCSRL